MAHNVWPHDLPRGLRLGTSSWSEKSWVGPFYPSGTPAADYLAYYATRFPTVEADVTYYRVPSTAMVKGWARRTPDGFKLSAKFPRSIVHCGSGPVPDGTKLLDLSQTDRECDAFLHAMSTLGDRCGPLVIQLPYLNRETFSGLDAFLERLGPFLERLPRDFRYAVEVRNKAWLAPSLTDLLAEHRCALVLVDLLYMPHPDEVADRIPLVTTDFVYARLIGDRKKIDKLSGKRFDKLVFDQRPRLERWAEVLREVTADVPETYAFANNHYAGHGPATVAQLAALIRGQEPGPLPEPAGQTDLPF